MGCAGAPGLRGWACHGVRHAREPSAAAGLFEGFEARDVPTSRGTVHAMVGGSGPPLLLLTATRSRT